MATIVNIFGKLYTFLRRPEQGQNNEAENQSTEQVENQSTDQEENRSMDQSAEDISQNASINEVGDVPNQSDVVCKEVGVSLKMEANLEKLMTDSATSSGWELIPGNADLNHCGTDIDDIFTTSSTENQSVAEDLKEKPENDTTDTDVEIAVEAIEEDHENVNSNAVTNTEAETADSIAEVENADTETENTETKTETADTKSELENADTRTDVENADTKTEVENADTKTEVENADSKTDVENADTKTELENADTKTDVENADTKSEVENADSKTVVENADSKKVKTPKNIERKAEKKICKFFKQGQKCWKGHNCKFAHERREKTHVDDCEKKVMATVAVEMEVEKDIDESDFLSYADYVSAMTVHGRQINSKNLFYKLGYEKDTDLEKVGKAVLGQYTLAKGRNNWVWVKDARYYAELFFAPEWIDQNLPHKDQKSNRKNHSNKKEKNVNKQKFENPGGICRDFRLKDNPNLETLTANAAGDSRRNNNSAPAEGAVTNSGEMENMSGKTSTVDKCVTDYTDQVIQQAMKMAITDGLSESAILEVIDDVTTTSTSNVAPRKRGNLVKVDISRLSRSRPEQLAVGFNYHSDLIIKHSPKTVKGGIIPLDTHPEPRERPEQLALGFNYHAEQLIKESPKTETGKVLIPGVVASPRRLARDQLAVGFGYHSDLLAKASPNESQNDNAKVSTNNGSRVLMNGCDKENGNKNEIDVKKSAKRSISDTFAVGFSYNSNRIIKESLDEINGNLPEDNVVLSLIADAVNGEGRNTGDVNDDVPVIDLPAGSVW